MVGAAPACQAGGTCRLWPWSLWWASGVRRVILPNC